MSTQVLAPATLATPATRSTAWGAESRVLLTDVPWDLYERLRDLHGPRNVHMTYHRGSLELMSPSQPHEEYAARFEILILEVAKALGLSCKLLGSTTWKKKDESGKEADACFYLANAGRVRGKRIDLKNDPPPDLAVEVEISPPSIDVESVYAVLGVPEIWRFDGEALLVLVRQEDGTYAERERSSALPFLPLDEVLRLLRESEEIDDDARWSGEVARWRGTCWPRSTGARRRGKAVQHRAHRDHRAIRENFWELNHGYLEITISNKPYFSSPSSPLCALCALW